VFTSKHSSFRGEHQLKKLGKAGGVVIHDCLGVPKRLQQRVDLLQIKTRRGYNIVQ
jgi:hypothetical protein